MKLKKFISEVQQAQKFNKGITDEIEVISHGDLGGIEGGQWGSVGSIKKCRRVKLNAQVGESKGIHKGVVKDEPDEWGDSVTLGSTSVW